MARTKIKKVTVYMDGVDWRYEVGSAADGNTIYPTLDCLQEYHSCWKGCGVVECEITFKKWVIKEDLEEAFGDSSKQYSIEDLKGNKGIYRYEAALKRLEYLEKLVSSQKHKVVSLKADIKTKEKKNVTK